MLTRSHPDVAAKLLEEAQEDVDREWRVYSARAANPGYSNPKAILAAEPAKAPSALPAGGAE